MSDYRTKAEPGLTHHVEILKPVPPAFRLSEPVTNQEEIMQILVNSNHSVEVTSDLEEHVKATVESELERFDDQLTRVEVHLNDENSGKSGPHDKRCQMEARVKGHDPISTSHKADSLNLAIDGCAEKLSHALAHALDKKLNHH